MKKSISYVKVRYGETDQMGVVHHGNYAQFLELARIEWLEKLGVSYVEMERQGLMLPVYEMQLKFLKPAFFDDRLKVVTTLKKLPNVKIEFHYEIYNQQEELITTASTVLVFMNAANRKPVPCPETLRQRMED